MFIDWASQLSLLEHNPEAHILKNFSLPVQKVLVSQVVTFLLEQKNCERALTSPSHVSWAMETCGQGFSLPIDEAESITKVISLYHLWALDPTKRPKAINDNPQYFLQRILEHYSLLFQTRANTRELVEKHGQLCSTVLDIFVSIGRKIGHTFSVETWELFLKLLIGISDLILRQEAPPSQDLLQKKLCSQLFKVLFELWLLSRTRNPSLWEALKQRVRGWTHHMALVLTWKVTCIALTKRSAAILYGPSEGTDCVIISMDDLSQRIILEDEYVFYAWHRMLNLIGNPNESIEQPAIFLDFMGGVETLITQYLKIGLTKNRSSVSLEKNNNSSSKEEDNNKNNNNNNNLLSPSGNTILHIFGTWLFDAIHLHRSGFDEGTALATKILSALMSQKRNTDFLSIYSSNYYSSLQRALAADGRVLITAIISSTNLFTYSLNGSRCLVPYFVDSIYRICTGKAKLAKEVMPSEHVRRDCLTILSTIISLPNHLGSTKFILEQGKGKANDYNSLKPLLCAILLETLEIESYESNIELLLGLVFAWQLETISDRNNSDFTKKSVKLILRKLKSNLWTPRVTLFALQSLQSMSSHYSHISKGNVLANTVVDTLCKYITQCGNPTPKEAIVMSCFQCMTYWIMVKGQWIFEQKETFHAILVAIVIGITGKANDNVSPSEPVETASSKRKTRDKKKEKEEKGNQQELQVDQLSENIKREAKRTLQIILDHLGNFPAASGTASFSSSATEEEILMDMVHKSDGEISVEDTKHYVRYYITDNNVILCVINRLYFSSKPTVSVIIRDETGLYTWDTVLSHLPLHVPDDEIEAIDRSTPVTISHTPYQFQSRKTLPLEEISNVMNFFNVEKSSQVLQSIQAQVDRESAYLLGNAYHLDTDVTMHKPKVVPIPSGSYKVAQPRMFLSHLGFLSLENRNKLHPLTMNSSLFNLLGQLDNLKERSCIRVGILFVGKGQTEEEWYTNEAGSLDYQEFVTTLGWGVDLVKHRGFTGTLDVSGATTGRVAPYWSDFNTEVIFQVCTLIPLTTIASSDNEVKKRTQSLHSHCIVIWVEDFEHFHPQTIWKRRNRSSLLITVSPLESGLYHIRLFVKPGPETSSQINYPLVDNMVLRKEILGEMVRATAMYSWPLYEKQSQTPTQVRYDMISKINSSCKQVESLETFYTQQFTELPSDAIGPLHARPATPVVKTSEGQKSPVPLRKTCDSEDDTIKRKRKKDKKKKSRRKAEESEAESSSVPVEY